MKPLVIEGTDESPRIVLDAENSTFEISGRSLPEDSAAFFNPVLEWISEYAKHPRDTTVFWFKLDYFNTASSKFLYDILVALGSVSNTRIVWCFKEDDETTEEAGVEFSEQVNIPFEFRRYA